jgi:serine protease Do
MRLEIAAAALAAAGMVGAGVGFRDGNWFTSAAHAANTGAATAAPAPQTTLGLTARPLTPDEQREAQVKGGLLVEEAAGPAASAGVQPGDVILAMNGTPLRSIAQLRGLLAGSGKHVALLVQRDGTQLFVPVTLG